MTHYIGSRLLELMEAAAGPRAEGRSACKPKGLPRVSVKRLDRRGTIALAVRGCQVTPLTGRRRRGVDTASTVYYRPGYDYPGNRWFAVYSSKLIFALSS